MRCDHCKKEKSVKTYAEVKEGKRYRLSLCEDCLALYLSRAPEFSETTPPKAEPFWATTSGSPSVKEPVSSAEAPRQRKKRYPGRPVQCDTCNTTWHQAAAGLPGCSRCFLFFQREFQDLAKQLMPRKKDFRYEGAPPEGEDVHKQLRQTIRNKREQLRAVLTREAYEEAAVLRDEIAKLETELTTAPRESES